MNQQFSFSQADPELFINQVISPFQMKTSSLNTDHHFDLREEEYKSVKSQNTAKTTTNFKSESHQNDVKRNYQDHSFSNENFSFALQQCESTKQDSHHTLRSEKKPEVLFSINIDNSEYAIELESPQLPSSNRMSNKFLHSILNKKRETTNDNDSSVFFSDRSEDGSNQKKNVENIQQDEDDIFFSQSEEEHVVQQSSQGDVNNQNSSEEQDDEELEDEEEQQTANQGYPQKLTTFIIQRPKKPAAKVPKGQITRNRNTNKQIIDRLYEWRKINFKNSDISLKKAATMLKKNSPMCKKTLDDQLAQVKKGIEIGYDFVKYRNKKISHLRRFIRKNPLSLEEVRTKQAVCFNLVTEQAKIKHIFNQIRVLYLSLK